MFTRKNLLLLGTIILLLLILAGGYILYTIMGDYIIYTVKTLGQTKHKLTVYAKDWITGNPEECASIEVTQRIDSIEKEITHRKTNGSGVATFRLPPGEYRCRGRGIYSGYTSFINLNKDRKVSIEIWILVQ